MIDYTRFYQHLRSTPLDFWIPSLQHKIEQDINYARWGDLPKWLEALEALPAAVPLSVDLTSDYVRVGVAADFPEDKRKGLTGQLMAFHPWRKGPFQFFGIDIETEWRSDRKWNRIKNAVDLAGKTVLDVGCGNGYYTWRMLGEGAGTVIGIDPTLLYVIQFYVFQKYIQNHAAAVLPLGIDDMPTEFPHFDTVFSMGLLYHRRAPLDHLLQLKSFLNEDDGQLVLETLVIEGGRGDVLSPEGRYAKMPNVWFIPSCLTLESWLKRTGFKDIRLVDVSITDSTEQRMTPWMGFQSLADFLDPADNQKTVEGYPAPRRAVFTAKK